MSTAALLAGAGFLQSIVGWLFFRQPGVRFWSTIPIWRHANVLTPIGSSLWIGGSVLTIVGCSAWLFQRFG